nr:hemoblobin-interacting domain-containing protein [Paenibacillus phyllosphaerae]
MTSSVSTGWAATDAGSEGNAPAAAAAGTGQTFSDIHGNWSEAQITKWASLGLASGSNGQFRPGDSISRAEFAKLLNTLFGFKTKGPASFKDVEAGKWYADTVAVAEAAGYISGYPGELFKPEAAVTRQEAAKMAAGLFQLPGADAGVLASFRDASQIGAFAKDAMARLVSGGYMKGFADQTIRPLAPISRAEAIVLLDRLAGEIVNSPGTRNQVQTAGSFLISSPDVTLKDGTIDRNVLITPGVGEGDVTLDGVTVKGTLYVSGGGVNSIHVNDSNIERIVVDKPDAPVRVVLEGDSEVGDIEVESGANIEIGSGAKVDHLFVDETADGTELDINGTAGELKTEAGDTKLNDKAIDKGSSHEVEKGQVKKPPAGGGTDGTGGNPGNSGTPGTGGGGGGGGTTTPSTKTAPSLAADTTDNKVGNDITLTFTDNAAWRGKVKSVTVGASELTAGTDYTVAEGQITIKAAAFAAAGSYAITVKASGYTDATVTQQVQLRFAPALVADTTDNTIGRDITVTFTDNEGWQSKITSVAINSEALTVGTDYTISAGQIVIRAAVFAQAGSYVIEVKATGYTDAAILQTVSNPPGIETAPALTADTTDNMLGSDITLTFTDNADWRSKISKVTVGATELTAGEDYTVAAGAITIKTAAVSQEGSHTITVQAAGYTDASVTQQLGNWELIWNDEFDGGTGANFDTNGVDLSKWGYQNGTGAEYGLDGWGNNEQQYYQKDNIEVKDGHLVITAKKQTVNGKPYTSGRLWTSPTFSKTYGKFEARMKLPDGQGIWPAFWMMPKDSEYGAWASSGELDIMEARGRLPEEVAGTLHYGKTWPNNKADGGSYDFPEGESITGFHTYGVEWEPGEIRWYVDGKLFNTMNNWNSQGAGQPDKYAFPAPFDKEFYMILNLAVGGNFDGGLIPPDSKLPAKMEVDYVRAYELEGKPYRTPVEPSMDKDPIPAGAKPAVDGSYIYDADYAKPFKNSIDPDAIDSEGWYFLNGFNGTGTAGKEVIGDDTFAKVGITQPGDQAYSIQLIQHVPLAKGRVYKLSFDAKAAASRNMAVKFGGDGDNGWGSYSDQFDVALTTEVKHYEYRFQMASDTDPTARLEYNLGLNANAVWIGNVRVEETELLEDPNGAKQPLENGNHVYNGTFDLGTMDRMKYWNFNVSEGTVATASVDAERRQLETVITNGGTAPEAVTLVQKGMNLLQTDTYELTFQAKAEAARAVGVRVISKDGENVYASRNDFAIGTSSSEQKLTFTMPAGVTDLEGQLVFDLGGSNADVTIDNVKLVRTTNNNIDYGGINLFPLVNGDFSAGLSGWEPFTQGAQAGFNAADGVAKVAITNVGTEAWNVMFNQSGLQLKKGFTYELSFEALSSVDRDMQATLENASYTRRFDSGSIAIGSEWTKFDYTVKLTADDNLALKLLLGKTAQSPAGAHEVQFRNMVLQVKDAPVKRPPQLIADTTDNKVGQPIAITFTDNEAWRQTISAVKVGDTTLAASKYTVEAGAIVLSGDVFTAEGAQTITVKADGYGDTIVVQSLLTSDGNLLKNGHFSSGDSGWSLWNEMPDYSSFSVENGAANVQINYHGGIHPEWNIPISWSTQLMQENIKLEAGKTYELSFRAWSQVDRPILVEFSGVNNNQQQAFNITDDASAVYTSTIKPGAASTLTLKYLLGNVVSGAAATPDGPHLITIDDVVLKEVKTGPALTADVSDNKVGEAIDITFADDSVWREAITSVTINAAAVPADKMTIEAGKIHLAADLFPAMNNYTIAVQAANYGSAVVVQEVKTAAPNVAIGATASASTQPQPANLAIDGNASTRWESATADPQWIAVDLGAVYKLDAVVLKWEGAYGKGYKVQAATSASPGEGDWVDVFTEANGNGGTDTIVLGGTEARHIRAYGTVRGTQYGYSLWELEAYGTPVGGEVEPEPEQPELAAPPVVTADTSLNKVGQDIELTFGADGSWESAVTAVSVNGTALAAEEYTVASGKLTIKASAFQAAGSYAISVAATGYRLAEVSQSVTAADTNLALGATVTASSAKAPTTAGSLVDGDAGTRWEADWSAESTSPEWIVIDLGSEQSITQLKLVWETAYAKSVLVQAAGEGANLEDESSWQTVETLSRELTFTGSYAETVELGDAAAEGRYIRLYLSDKGLPPYGPSLFEVEVY